MSGYYYLNNRVAREYRNYPRKAKKQNQMEIVRNMNNSKKAFFKHMESKEHKNQMRSLFSIQQKGEVNQVDA